MKEDKKFYRFKLISHRIRHRLVLHTIRNFLLRFGLDIDPYYIELEGLDRSAVPLLKDNSNLYALREIEYLEFIKLYDILGWNTHELEKSFQRPHQCFGLYKEDDLAAMMVVHLDHFYLKGKRFDLKSNEAYLDNMYTYEDFRGKNIAPYLRYLSYQMLNKQGRDICYSVTQYFNRSSLQFKKKLNVKHLNLYLHLGLFKRYHRTFLLKSYG